MERATLNQLKVASPCTVSWDSMKGDDQVRFCGDCNFNVYNISEMSLDEVTHLLEKKEGRTCVRFFRRFDGTVITDDCPTGLRAARRRLMKVTMALSAAFTAAAFWAGPSAGRALRDSRLGKVEIVRRVADWLDPREGCSSSALMGAVPAMGRPAMGSYEIKGEMMAPTRPSPPPEVKMGKVVRTR